MRQIKSFWAEEGRVQAWYHDTEGGYNDGPISYPKCVVWEPKSDEVVYSSVVKNSNEYVDLLQEAKKYYNLRRNLYD